MQGRLLFLILSLFFIISSVSSVNLDVEVRINSEVTNFLYVISFEEGKSYSSFAFEKPRDAILIVARDNEGNFVRHSIAGDFFILRPDSSTGDIITIEFQSRQVSESFYERNSFSNYVYFNIPLEYLEYQLYYDTTEFQILDVFPRQHEILSDGSVYWELNNISEESLFIVEFLSGSSPMAFWQKWRSEILLLISVIILLISLILVISFVVMSVKKKKQKEDIQHNVSESNTLEVTYPVSLDQSTENQKESPESDESEETKDPENIFEDFIKKYLTENEQEVAKVIKTHEGISQNDILNHLPHLTKSNLSKIISKLHSKKIFNRIKVGKVNKIYLGSKLKPETPSSKDEEQ